MEETKCGLTRRRRASGIGWGQLPLLRRRIRLDQMPDPSVDVADAAVISIEAARVRRHLRQLPALERRVICWRFGIGGEELTYREIAERLRMPQGSIWKIEQAALELLRAAYGLEEAA